MRKTQLAQQAKQKSTYVIVQTIILFKYIVLTAFPNHFIIFYIFIF